MVTDVQVRARLDTNLFNKYGKTVTLSSKTASSYNERGDEISFSSTPQSIVVMPYDITEDRRTYESFGSYKQGDVAMVLRYDQVVGIGDLISMEGVVFEIQEVVKNYLPGNVATIIRCSKTTS